MKHINTKKLCRIALMTAFTCIATMAVRIPVSATSGYIHLGDSLIFISGILFGWEYGMIAGGLGSAAADVLSGYPHWIIPTLIIKGIMGFAVGKISNADKSRNFFSARNNAAVIIGIIIMTVGYFIGGAVINGSAAAALVSVPENLIQGIGGGILHCVIGFALYKARIYRFAEEE